MTKEEEILSLRLQAYSAKEDMLIMAITDLKEQEKLITEKKAKYREKLHHVLVTQRLLIKKHFNTPEAIGG